MALADLSPAHRTQIYPSQIPSLSSRRSTRRQFAVRLLPARAQRQPSRVFCSAVQTENQQVQTPVAVETEAPNSRTDCYGVFCLTYDLKAEEETKSWKKLIKVVVSGAAGMISNHLLFKESFLVDPRTRDLSPSHFA